MLKKVNKLRQDGGGEKVESLEPPKNLPDLARDLYEREKTSSIEADKTTASNAQPVSNPINTNNTNNFSRPVNEPSKESVPGLDLSLVRQHLAASQSAIQSVQQSQSQNVSPNYTSYGSNQQPVYQQVPLASTQVMPPASISQNISQQGQVQDAQSSSQSIIGNANLAANDDTGFFREFEEYVRNNGLNTGVIDELLDKNLLDHMMFYHTTKGEDMPFYASSAELSHAIKVKLEELQNFERSWISNKQKMDLMKKWGSTVESDIHLRSEELKKLMAESRRRGNANNVKSDFFTAMDKVETRNPNQSNVLSPTIASVYRQSSQPQSSMNYSSAPVSATAPLPQVQTVSVPISVPISTVSTVPSISHVSDQPIILSKYNLNNYITHDPSKFFYVSDGQVFKSLSDLMNGLDNMSRETFNHHVNNSRNDFANWIKGVFGDFKLSDSLRAQTDREGLWYFLKNNTFQ